MWDPTLAYPLMVDAAIYHDFDDNGVGFVDYASQSNVIFNLSDDDIQEGETITLSGSFSNDPQAHTLTINWGDGIEQDVVLPLGTFTFSIDHTYSDDPPSGTSADTLTVSATLADFSGGIANYSDSITMHNVAPTLNLGGPFALDPTFGSGGKVLTNFVGGSGDRGYDMAVQSDGKIIVVGQSDGDFAVARYNADGSLDTTFGTGGRVTTDFGTADDGARSVAIQPDGQIVVAGYRGPMWTTSDVALARYNPDGSLDSSFGVGGKAWADVSGSVATVALDVAMQPDGKIVVAGGYYPGVNGWDFFVARYTDAGALDTGFDTDGWLKTDFGVGSDSAYAVAIQSDGKIVAVGQAARTASTYDFGVARYNPDGSLDTSFDGDGKAMTDLGGFSDLASGVAVQPDCRIVAAGASYQLSGASDFGLVRYNANGSLDASFDDDGRVITNFGVPGDAAHAMVLQSDGKIVVAGEANGDFALARYNADGSLDATFAPDGKITTDLGTGDTGMAMAVQADGRIVVAGYSAQGATGVDFALARYFPAATVAEGRELSLVDLGTFTDPGFGTETFTYTINWGDGTTADTGSPAIDVAGSEGIDTAGSFDGSHTYADNGAYTVTVTVADDDGGSDVKTFIVTV
jgi:uncharacterized delta-60 repeat protein